MNIQKSIIGLLVILISAASACSAQDDTAVRVHPDTSQLSVWIGKAGLAYRLPRRWANLPETGPAIVEKKEVSCYPSVCAHRSYAKRDDMYVRFSFQEISATAGDKVREVIPDFDENKNYLGNETCLEQRTAGWLTVMSVKDRRATGADSVFTYTVPATDFEPYLGKYDGRIVVVLHKRDRADMTVEYLYPSAKRKRVLKLVRKIGEMVSFR